MDTQTARGPSSLGHRIRHRRQALGLRTAEVAERAGLTTDRIEHIESRPFALTGAELLRLAHALDLTVEELTGPRHPANPPRPPMAPVLEPMRREECIVLIRAGSIGRIAYSGIDEVVVIPVNYRYRDELIVFRTAADSAVAQFDLDPIAFELDLFDEGLRDGWSVLVNGLVRPATDAETEANRDHLDTWAGGTRETYMIIEPHRITGRRIRSW
ncbi:helix-turn-helix domain-containing protein [Kribbella speibonae]|uniref:Helix-turn-helix domain-containing protein n=1 Tax=Kribbella speibonae TaxID=1572660 RepID=A0A4R0ICD6_9ACTN|nr:pyridoxamine 5'-phosphate oxidase family protein [Kribbella speibonae]TCC30801.1 helix-turn-helix domain-containing protein [Kribbella speibonae]